MSGTITLGQQPLHGVDGNGTRWYTETWPSPGSPGSSAQSTQKTAGPGSWRSAGFLTERSVPVNGWVIVETPALMRRAFDDLNAACAVGEDVPLSVTTDDGDTRWLLVRRQGEVLPEVVSATAAKWSIQVVAADPRWFADAVSDSTGLPSSVGGLTAPFTAPFTIDATVVSGSVSLHNPGTTAGPVVIRVDGPCQGPVITHTGSGKRLMLATDLVLAADQFITIDMENELVLAQGQSARNGWVVERGWSRFDEGDNAWLFTHHGAYNDLTSMTVTAWPAWP